MQIKSKAWDWTKNTRENWSDPSEISYYLINRWKKNNYKSFLDLGCGIGRHSIQFAENDFDVFSFDLSLDGLSELSKKITQHNLKIQINHGDMMKLPYKDDSFDCVLAYNVISHTDSIGIIEVISELIRVLKPGKEFFVTLCSKNAWSYKDAGFPIIDDNTVRKVEDGPENGIPHYFADLESIRKLFENEEIINLQHIQDLVVDTKEYVSWHYHLLGKKKNRPTTGST